MIVAGLVAVMVHLFSDQSPDDVVRFDAPTFFKDIGLADALTPQRSNGLAAMLARIRSLARSADENNAA
jgi:cysteine desulfuration protein SufE